MRYAVRKKKKEGKQVIAWRVSLDFVSLLLNVLTF